MDINVVKEILRKIEAVKIAVYGDFCLDAYWMLAQEGGEISVETGLKTEAVKKQSYTPGGASNVVANIAALNPAEIRAIGVIGPDIFGRELNKQLTALGVDTESLIIQEENFDTVTFSKRYLKDEELPRIDFGFFNKRTRSTDARILESIRDSLVNFDVLIFNQQVPGSLTNPEFIEECNALFRQFDDKIVLLDSRHYARKFNNVYRKSNEVEAASLSGKEAAPGDLIPLRELKEIAKMNYEKSGKPAFITRGGKGILAIDEQGIHEIAGIQLLNKIDAVGAGDTTISALALCLGAGISPENAARFANLAAAVTVQKLFTTGTASPDEIIFLSENVDYIFLPELAEDFRQAVYLPDSEIEICQPLETFEFGKIKHAVFDHDGTVSALREGWEGIMEPVMMHAILGSQYDTAGEVLFKEVRQSVLEFIDSTTGIQTIVQMEGLVNLVKEFGIVPENEVLDKFGYKEIYNKALMEMVNQRVEKLTSRKLDQSDFTIKGSIEFLKMLREKGVTLYLASGTDRIDVEREAEVLGYADLFNGGIHGAIGDIKKYSKKLVIEKIINENQLKGSELAVIGDGPVEMRECRRRNGIAIGIASDEIRRHGLNAAKRSRLIKAGAQIIIPDFSIREELMTLLFHKY